MESRTLYKVKDQATISGVCAGLAEYLDMDTSLVRILFAVISLFTGVPIIIYIVFAFVLPDKQEVISRNVNQDNRSNEEDDYTL